jgi:hypothetical protein
MENNLLNDEFVNAVNNELFQIVVVDYIENYFAS